MNSKIFSGIDGVLSVLFFPEKDDEILEGIKPTTILYPNEQTKVLDIESSSYDAVLGVSKLPYSPIFLSNILRILKPGGILSIQGEDETNFNRSLLYAGFVDITTLPNNKDKKLIQIIGKKPQAQMSSAIISLNKNKNKNKNKINDDNNNNNNNNQSQSKSNKKSEKWTLNNNDMIDDDIELEDEDTLLDHEVEKVIVQKPTDTSDCGTDFVSSRKPCKNCTCGRATLNNNNNNNDLSKPKELIKSSCGSCHLGDAFRCASCPYLGQPAFDPGDTVKLSLN